MFSNLSSPRTLARTLAWLRLCAIGGQSVAVLVAWLVLHLDLPLLHLFAAIGVLAVFAVLAAWRLNQGGPVTETETIGHIAADTLVLWCLLYFTGGATNPFVTLLLMPIALGAAALSVRALLAVALLAGIAYLMLMVRYVPLPPLANGQNGFELHVVGMAVNFAITALLLGFFINRLATAVRQQQMEVQRIRERALRDEGILAIATQAAGAAHELNTPLSTMRTLLPELRRDHADNAPLTDDLGLLQEQVERCRTILREMVAFGKMQLSQEDEQMSVGHFVHSCLERFQLLRPEADLTLELDPATEATVLRSPPGLRHALINLLNNAADASALRGSQQVALRVQHASGWLELCVRDRGPGFMDGPPGTLLGQSEKLAGLGIGLTLAEATADRLNGELHSLNTSEGAEVSMRLPLSAITGPD